jgi:hypothetical protein
MTACCAVNNRGRYRVCRSEKHLVIGAMGMIFVLGVADDVRMHGLPHADPSQRSTVQPLRGSTVPQAPLLHGSRPTQSGVSITVRALDLSSLPASAFAD